MAFHNSWVSFRILNPLCILLYFSILVNNAAMLNFNFRGIRRISMREVSSGNAKLGEDEVPQSLKDALHGVKMGISTPLCDNAKDDLFMDWDGNPVNFTCYHPKSPLTVDSSIKPVESCDVPENYIPRHICMKQKIHYNVSVPTYGDHRPLWPVYGEYLFVPPQRWLHSIEHGAIIMLYNPCAQPLEVERLRILVKGCLRRHIITPYSLLPKERPLALVAWGCKLLMNHVDQDVVIKFIKEHALHGPEGHLSRQGLYKFRLLDMAFAPQGSDFNDVNLCPEVEIF